MASSDWFLFKATVTTRTEPHNITPTPEIYLANSQPAHSYDTYISGQQNIQFIVESLFNELHI